MLNWPADWIDSLWLMLRKFMIAVNNKMVLDLLKLDLHILDKLANSASIFRTALKNNHFNPSIYAISSVYVENWD